MEISFHGGFYKLKGSNLRVILDAVDGTLEVHSKKLDLFSVDNENGVDVELQLDTATSVENILMIE